MDGFALERLREAEVQHLHAAVVCDLDVGRFQIAMNDPCFVRRFQRLGDLPRDRQRLLNRHGAADDPLGERLTGRELHHQELPAAGFFEAVNRGDAGMVQRRQHARFALESCQALGVLGEGLGKDLDRDAPAQPRIRGLIHLTHAT